MVDNSDVVGALPVGKRMQETFEFWDLVRLILEDLGYQGYNRSTHPEISNIDTFFFVKEKVICKISAILFRLQCIEIL